MAIKPLLEYACNVSHFGNIVFRRVYSRFYSFYNFNSGSGQQRLAKREKLAATVAANQLAIVAAVKQGAKIRCIFEKRLATRRNSFA